MENQNKRLIKNTLMLYFRMFFIMFVGLYISRVVLKELGAIDFGLYNVVGGVVTLFAFVQTALGNATWRYINVSLGKNDSSETQEIFSYSIFLHLILCILVLVLAESIGLWFFYNKLNIPVHRLSVSFYVYQLSIITVLLTIIMAPYQSLITAHEKMNAFAFISILEVIAKLLLAFSLIFVNVDKLLLYAIFLAVLQFIVNTIYFIYCRRNFKESSLVYKYNATKIKEMATFAFYTVIPGLGFAASGQGINILLNIFWGPTVNAARGISIQVQSLVVKFVQSFQIAVNPQITQEYIGNNRERLEELVGETSKFSFYLVLIMSIPIINNMDYLLSLWLCQVPDFTSQFCVFTLIYSMFDVLAYPFLVGAAANGNIRSYYTINGIILISSVPLAYLALRYGFNPLSVYYVQLALFIILLFFRVYYGAKLIDYPLRNILAKILKPVILVALFGYMFSFIIHNFVVQKDCTLLMVLLDSIASVLVIISVVYFIGLSKKERKVVEKVFINKMRRIC